MAIFRIEKNNDFVTMDRTGLKDKTLSWKAKGLLAYMLSLPDDWEFYDSELQQHSKDGRDALKSAIKELKDGGYLIRKQVRKKNGKIAYETTVVEKPSTVNPSTENPSLLNIDTPEEEENALKFYTNNFGQSTPFMMQNIGYWIDDLSNGVVIEAMKEALNHNARNWKYVESILKDWLSKNVKTVDDLNGLKKEKEKPKQKQSKSNNEEYASEVSIDDELDAAF